MSRGNQPRLAASRMFRWLRFSEWYHGCDAAAVSDMLTLRCSQVKRKRRPVLLATCMDDLVQVSAEDGLSGHNKGRSGVSAPPEPESPKILPFAPRGRLLSPRPRQRQAVHLPLSSVDLRLHGHAGRHTFPAWLPG